MKTDEILKKINRSELVKMVYSDRWGKGQNNDELYDKVDEIIKKAIQLTKQDEAQKYEEDYIKKGDLDFEGVKIIFRMEIDDLLQKEVQRKGTEFLEFLKFFITRYYLVGNAKKTIEQKVKELEK